MALHAHHEVRSSALDRFNHAVGGTAGDAELRRDLAQRLMVEAVCLQLLYP
jgi:hypothetical protein